MSNPYLRIFNYRIDKENEGFPVNKNIYISVSTQIIENGYKLTAAKKDSDGYYCDVPAIVLGKVTRNNTAYDTDATVAQLRGPDTSIFKRISEGVLFSEYGHPFVDLKTTQGLTRLCHLEPTRKSGHIRSMTVRHVEDLNLDIIFMDIKPAGPYGSYYDEQMMDPTQNCAYSLRGISAARVDPRTRVVHKRLNPLVTIDTGVAGGGFKEASKRYMPSVEGLQIYGDDIDAVISEDMQSTFHQVAMESFTDTELNDIFKSKSIIVGTQVSGHITSSNTVVTPGELPSGLMHSIIKSKRG